jgi:hypothetical protein
MTADELERVYGRPVPPRYREMLASGELERACGKRPPKLAHWAESMSTPLEFAPEVVSEVFANRLVWAADDEGFASMIPLARFLTQRGDALAERDDFLALRSDGAVCLWDHDGSFIEVAASLDHFIKSLRMAD